MSDNIYLLIGIISLIGFITIPIISGLLLEIFDKN